jgi:L-aspartate semialdehyde sulfurtransferase ferredoxin
MSSRMGASMKVERSICMWCGACVGFCPRVGVTLFETRIEFNEHCNGCGICIPTCPVGAISKDESDDKKCKATKGGA